MGPRAARRLLPNQGGRHERNDSTLIVDASPVGLGAVLTQHSHGDPHPRPVLYASRSLTPTEERYSQTEREALAIVWACEHFHLYIYGAPFVVVTNHKPLTTIFSTKATNTPPGLRDGAFGCSCMT